MKKQGLQNGGINISGVNNSSINIAGGDINNTTTNINTGSGDIILGDKITTIDKAFFRLNRVLEGMPEGIEKTETQETLRELENEAWLGENASENRVTRWMNFLAETAPDVWEVAIATFINPVAGVGLVFKKVAEHARRLSRR